MIGLYIEHTPGGGNYEEAIISLVWPDIGPTATACDCLRRWIAAEGRQFQPGSASVGRRALCARQLHEGCSAHRCPADGSDESDGSAHAPGRTHRPQAPASIHCQPSL